MKNKRIYILIGIVLIAAIVMFYFYKVNNTSINVKTYEVSNGSIKKYINLIGEVESNSIEKFNFSDGRPRKINVKVGDNVKKGDLIASSSFGNSISSIDGVVTKVDEGNSSFAGLSTSTVIVQDTKSLKITVEVNKNDYKELKVGEKAIILNNNGVKVDGEVSFINPTADKKNTITDSESYVKADIKILKEEDFIIGFSNEVDILVGEVNDVIVVPIEAVLRGKGNETYVYVVENNRLNKRKVVVGLEGEQEVEIKEGLSEKEEIVLNPSNSFSDGEKITRRKL